MRQFIVTALLCFTMSAKAAVNQDVVSGFNHFALTTHQHLYQANASAVYSPYSIGTLLALLISGSAGSTQQELKLAFHLTAIDTLNPAIDELNQSLTKDKDVIISNAFWVDNQFHFNTDYMNRIKQMRSVAVYPVDFAKSGAAIKNQINDWADHSTRGYIKSLLNNPLDENTKLVLTNAVYFKGMWSLPFDSKQTAQQAFTTQSGHKKMLPMMHRTDRFHYAENDIMQMLVLSYDQSSLAMALLLPKPGKQLQDINKQLTSDQFKQLCEHAASMPLQVVVTLPKFKINSTLSTDLQRALKSVGIRDAFDSMKANFSNMTSTESPGLYISETLQKAVIEVDEKGTVAAAASAVVLATRSMVTGTQPTVFRADHPFMFIIFDKSSGLILFMGELQ